MKKMNMRQPQDVYWWCILWNSSMELQYNTNKVKYLQKSLVSHEKVSCILLKISHLYLSDCAVSIRLQLLLNGISVSILFKPFQTVSKWAKCSSVLPFSCCPYRIQQTQNTCPLLTMLRDVKPMQSIWVHSSLALAFLLRMSILIENVTWAVTKHQSCRTKCTTWWILTILKNPTQCRYDRLCFETVAWTISLWQPPDTSNGYEIHSNYFLISHVQPSKMEPSWFF